MIAIISDIHGNVSALKAVLNEIDSLNVEQIICLGDVVGYYCEVNECCDILRERNIYTLLGNHDYYLTHQVECVKSNSVNRCIEYQKEIISSENLEWLKSLSPKGTLKNLNIVHAGWNDPLEEYFMPVNNYFSDIPGLFFMSGHTHVPIIWQNNQKTYCNPGSVGQPRDGNPAASYASFDGQSFSLYRVDYDYSLLQKKMKAAGFSEYFYKNLEDGTRLGGKVDQYNLSDI